MSSCECATRQGPARKYCVPCFCANCSLPQPDLASTVSSRGRPHLHSLPQRRNHLHMPLHDCVTETWGEQNSPSQLSKGLGNLTWGPRTSQRLITENAQGDRLWYPRVLCATLHRAFRSRPGTRRRTEWLHDANRSADCALGSQAAWADFSLPDVGHVRRGVERPELSGGVAYCPCCRRTDRSHAAQVTCCRSPISHGAIFGSWPDLPTRRVAGWTMLGSIPSRNAWLRLPRAARRSVRWSRASLASPVQYP